MSVTQINVHHQIICTSKSTLDNVIDIKYIYFIQHCCFAILQIHMSKETIKSWMWGFSQRKHDSTFQMQDMNIETLVCKITEIYIYLRKDPFTIWKLTYGVLLMWIGRDRCCWSIRFLSSSGLGDFLPIVWTPPFFFSRNHRKPGLCVPGFERGFGSFVNNYAKHSVVVVRGRNRWKICCRVPLHHKSHRNSCIF